MNDAAGPAGPAARPARAEATANGGLTSFGVTMAAWSVRHHASGAYSNVTPQGGRVVEYTINTG